LVLGLGSALLHGTPCHEAELRLDREDVHARRSGGNLAEAVLA
jgi:hypothetical protein